ncbi:hypothetical protein RCZ15_00610 [Capnocytophaga catalasegens]|uniref:Uncharacterized protein n=1 Tax=Capnocytophaga catalasegens TaxID=1004260 RepID=A0AAV5ATR0_9FLAO|nr:hypothetical protein RCZ03_00880 [Capnocytophaga catalasegens]GJM49085.1 hypothetical protein RCZ15_00610 [Capnocytophaga catalasegens]GJM52346.1 hypothetical protein RCZ16_06640 [Capnocytophaga catalasegens]
MKQILSTVKTYIIRYVECFIILILWLINIIFKIDPSLNKFFFFIYMIAYITKQNKLKKIEKERKTKEISH